MAQRSLWSGSISFGLVNVPVRLFSATREHKAHFHYVHAPDAGPIGYQKVCKTEERPVSDDEVVKAFEVTKGEYVYVDDADFETARGQRERSIEILDFVPAAEIDPIYFAKAYYLGAAKGDEKVYSLFLRALRDAALIGVVKFHLRDRQHLGGLRVQGKVLVLEQLYFEDEVLATAEIEVPGARVSKDELDLARRLIEQSATSWKPARYKDTYERDLRKAIEAKRQGQGVHETEDVAEPAEVPDLMAALRASIEQTGRRKPNPRRRRVAA
jgi:DNA end-binding protein Ku